MIEFNEYHCNNAQDVKDYFLKLDKGTIENAEEFKGVFRNTWKSKIINFNEKSKQNYYLKLYSVYYLYILHINFPPFSV